MKQLLGFLVVGGILSFAICAPYEIKTLENINIINPDGSYHYNYYLDNGATQNVAGQLKNVNGVEVYTVRGSYSYPSDGRVFTVEYIADENGFRIISIPKEYPRPSIDPKAVASLLGG